MKNLELKRLGKNKPGLFEKFLLRIAKQWIAGNTFEDAVKSAKLANAKGMDAIINKLGEHILSKQQIDDTVEEYLKMVSSLRELKVSGGVSVKPTQVGLSKSFNECKKNVEKIIDMASISQSFVWIDMESSEYTEDTIKLYHSMFERYERLGIAIQANLKRSNSDLETHLQHGAKIRLVKGAYRESKAIAYKTRDEVDENFKKLTKLLFLKGNEFAIATHDSRLIDLSIELSKKYERKFEFQMLKGIRDELKPVLIKSGYSVTEYIPYGTNWLPYSIRRLKERKRNILLLGSSFLHSHRV